MSVFRYIFLLSVALFFSCQKSIGTDQMVDLNGYWEIEKAEMPDGTVKEYSINMTIDYFEVKQDSGFRQKVVPQFDGGYLTNEVREDLKLVYEDDQAWISYHTQFAQWKERVVEINSERLVIKNEHDMVYYYKRPVAFSVK